MDDSRCRSRKPDPINMQESKSSADSHDDDAQSFASRSTHFTKTADDLSNDEESDDSSATYKSCKTFRSGKSRSPGNSRERDSPGRARRHKRSCCGYVTYIAKMLILIPLLILACLLIIGYFVREPNRIKCRLDILPHTLYTNIYGQELAIGKISKSMVNFCNDFIPGEPLVLVFWGQTGVGKTLAATLLAEHFGLNSQVVPSEMFDKSKYRDWLGSNSPTSGLHVYAIDDVGSAAELSGLVEVTQFLYPGPLVLVLTASLESQSLNDTFMEHSSKGNSQESFEYQLSPPSFLKGLHHLSPVLVPFLPLTRTHIKLCIEKEMNRLKINHKDTDVEKISNELEYFNDGKRLFSKIGCKQLSNKIFMVKSP